MIHIYIQLIQKKDIQMKPEVEEASDLIPSLGHQESMRSIYFDARSQGQQSSSLGLSSRVPSLDGISLDSGSEQDVSSVDTEIVADKNNEDSLSGEEVARTDDGSPSIDKITHGDQKASEKAFLSSSLIGRGVISETSGGGERQPCQIQTSDACRAAGDAETVLPKISDAKEHNQSIQDDPSDVRSTLHVTQSTANHLQNQDEACGTQNRATKLEDCSTCKQCQSEIDALVIELNCAQRMIKGLVSENALLGDEIVHLKHCADEERRRMEVERTRAIASLIAENQMLQSLLDETKQALSQELRIRNLHEENHKLKGKPLQQVRWKRPPPLGITDGGTISLTQDHSESHCVGYSPLSAGRLLQS